MNIKQEIAELKTRLEQLEAECEAGEESEWPRDGDIYYVVHSVGYILNYTWYGHSVDELLKQIGNIFKTQQEAEAEVAARKVIAELRATEGRVKPFNNEHTIYGVEVGLESVGPVTHMSDVGLFWQTQEHAQQAINQVGEARIIAAVKHFGRV